jgi:hypothetical protein
MRLAGHVTRMGRRGGGGGKECVYALVGMPEGKRPQGPARHRQVDNIKMDLGEIGWGGMDRNYLSQEINQLRGLVNVVMNFWAP